MSDNLNILFKIKSRYIIKKISFYLSDRKKSQISLLNNKLHDIMNIDIEFIKKVSGKYKKAPENGKGKEYILDTDKIIFEGEYKNRKKSGKGKEYDKYGYLIFEGEYLNGKRNGKGKEYYNDSLLFEGEYLNGEKNGQGIEYYDNEQYKFKGIYKKGKKWDGVGYNDSGNEEYIIKNGSGKVKEYNDIGILIFEGEYLNCQANGYGKEYNGSKGKLEFEGEFKNGKKWNGKITKYNDYGNLVLDAYYQNGIINGKVKEWDINKNCIFDGEYLNGKKWNSKLIEYKFSETSYQCEKIYYEYINGKKIEYTYNDENILKKQIENDCGKIIGKEFYKNGQLKYEGEYKGLSEWEGKGYTIDGDINYIIHEGSGKVKEYNWFGNLIFEGEYLNGEINGKCKEYNYDGLLLFEGEYLNGEKNGKCKEYNNDGNLIFEGEYLNGEKNGKVKEYNDDGNLIFEGEMEKKMENVKNIVGMVFYFLKESI